MKEKGEGLGGLKEKGGDWGVKITTGGLGGKIPTGGLRYKPGRKRLGKRFRKLRKVVRDGFKAIT